MTILKNLFLGTCVCTLAACSMAKKMSNMEETTKKMHDEVQKTNQTMKDMSDFNVAIFRTKRHVDAATFREKKLSAGREAKTFAGKVGKYKQFVMGLEYQSWTADEKVGDDRRFREDLQEAAMKEIFVEVGEFSVGKDKTDLTAFAIALTTIDVYQTKTSNESKRAGSTLIKFKVVSPIDIIIDTLRKSASGVEVVEQQQMEVLRNPERMFTILNYLKMGLAKVVVSKYVEISSNDGDDTTTRGVSIKKDLNPLQITEMRKWLGVSLKIRSLLQQIGKDNKKISAETDAIFKALVKDGKLTLETKKLMTKLTAPKKKQ